MTSDWLPFDVGNSSDGLLYKKLNAASSVYAHTMCARIVLCCHLDGQVSGISAKAVSCGAILIGTAVVDIMRLAKLTDLLLCLLLPSNSSDHLP